MSEDKKHNPDNKPLGTIDPKGDYRKLGQPADTVSGTTKELFEVRGPGGGSDASSVAFKIIAALAIVGVVVAIVLTQFGALG